eukprot:751427-Hanusia_phi.AAC.1
MHATGRKRRFTRHGLLGGKTAIHPHLPVTNSERSCCGKTRPGRNGANASARQSKLCVLLDPR